MLTITLKRSAATLGVVAGLLAAAGPASAKTMAEDSWTAAKAPGAWVWHEAARNGVTAAGPTEIFDHGITQADDRPTESVSFLTAAAEGTQVGSEGVKAPTPTAVLIQKHDGQCALKAPTPTAGTQVGFED
jgi:hypothetical protein